MLNPDFIEFESLVNDVWEKRANLKSEIDLEKIKKVIDQVLNLLDQGILRVAEKKDNIWIVNEWVKKAVLISFKLNDNHLISSSCSSTNWFDKVSSKFLNWKEHDFINAGFRAVPGSYVRHSAYIAKNVILMPSFINVGAYIGDSSMIDTWSTIGSCAQIGKNCHISGGVGIGGVLEPLQAKPVIIEDNCFIGARSEIAEGVIIEQGSVISMGVYLGASTKIFDRETGEIHYGRVPANSVVVPGNLPSKDGSYSLYAAIIVKKADEKTKSKTSINEEILRS